MAKQGKYSKPNEKSMLPVILLILLLLLFLIFGGIFACTAFGGSGGAAATVPFVPELDENAAAWNGMPTEATEPKAPTPGIAIPGYPTIRIPADKKDVNLPLHNPEGNPCYFTFTLVLSETEEVLYESKQVPPGQGIAAVTLNRALPKGEHSAVIQIRTNSLTDGSPMNGANMVTTLVAE